VVAAKGKKDVIKCELEVNDLPDGVRQKILQKETLEGVVSLSLMVNILQKETLEGVVSDYQCPMTQRGRYVPRGIKCRPGERKLYLLIEGRQREAIVDTIRMLGEIAIEETERIAATAVANIM
ncbi:hypothetical protein KIPB_012018, partial [Kipferlia bialata]